MNNFLAIDQGTTSSRAIIFSPNHEPIRDSQKEYALSYPNDGWVEAEPSDILKTVKETLENVIKQSSEIISFLRNNKSKRNNNSLVYRDG